KLLLRPTGGERVVCYLSCAFAAALVTNGAAESSDLLHNTSPPLSTQPARSTPTPPSLTGSTSSQINPVLPAPESSTPAVGPLDSLLQNPLRWGPFQLRPHFDYRFYYATQIYVQPGEVEDTVRHSVSPGLLIQSPHVS